MKIYIDGDGCPVVDITIGVAALFKVECVIVCDTSHHFHKEGVRTITVSKGKDSVDFALLNLPNKGDIVITGDYGLAAMCLARGCVAIHQNGLIYTNDNINALLTQRHNNAIIRKGGGRTAKVKKRLPAHDIAFKESLLGVLGDDHDL